MLFLTGDTRSRRLVATLATLGWGRMVVARSLTFYPGEPWALDNGAFAAWKHGAVWPEVQFRRLVAWSVAETQAGRSPLFAVTPDIVAAGAVSLAFSLTWREQLPDALPWLLAVQDGMQPAAVEAALETARFAGLFLGGTLAFKRTAGERYRDLARARGLWFHYGRASRFWLAAHAWELGADSADSTGPLWSVGELKRHRGLWERARRQEVMCFD